MNCEVEREQTKRRIPFTVTVSSPTVLHKCRTVSMWPLPPFPLSLHLIATMVAHFECIHWTFSTRLSLPILTSCLPDLVFYSAMVRLVCMYTHRCLLGRLCKLRQINSRCFVMAAGLLKGSFSFIFTTSLLASLPAGKPRRVSCVAKPRRCTEALLFSLITPAAHCTSSDNGDTRQIMLGCLSEESSQMGAVSHVVPGRSDRSTIFPQNNKAQCCLCSEFKPAPGLSLGSIHSVLPGC